MKNVFALTVMVMSLASAAFAQENASEKQNMALCKFLPVKEHFVSADYVPGVDVKGNPVVPADVKAQANEYVDVIRIPVTVDMAQNLTQALPQGTEMNAAVAMVEIYKNSRVMMNGQDVTSAAYNHCGKEPFDIEKASVEKVQAPTMPAVPVTPVVPSVKPEKEEIIWGEGY